MVSLEEFAKANRRSILGIGVNAEYIEPSQDEVVPINDNDTEEVNKKAKSSSSSQGKEDSDDAVKVSKKNHQLQTKRWWWPW